MYVDSSTGRKIFDAAVRKLVVGTTELPVTSPEHLAMMKALAMKNAPKRTLFEAEDVRFLASLPGTDREAIRDYFDRHGLREMWNVIEENG